MMGKGGRLSHRTLDVSESWHVQSINTTAVPVYKEENVDSDSGGPRFGADLL